MKQRFESPDIFAAASRLTASIAIAQGLDADKTVVLFQEVVDRLADIYAKGDGKKARLL